MIIICDNDKKSGNNSECVALIYIKDVDNEYSKTTNFFRRISFLQAEA